MVFLSPETASSISQVALVEPCCRGLCPTFSLLWLDQFVYCPRIICLSDSQLHLLTFVCTYPSLAWLNPHYSQSLQWTIVATLSWWLLYFVWGSLEHLLVICKTVFCLPPHILHIGEPCSRVHWLCGLSLVKFDLGKPWLRIQSFFVVDGHLLSIRRSFQNDIQIFVNRIGQAVASQPVISSFGHALFSDI